MITFDHVSKRYGERLALDSVSWHMEEGESVVFLGRSGAGKTTLLRLITHETQPTSGRISVGTFQGSRLGRHQRALLRRTLGIIYEDFRLLDDRTVFENVALAVHITGRFHDEDVVPAVLHALDEVGMRGKASSLPRELSAGEKQRAAIARAIVNRPAVILADEPTGALEPDSAAEILERLRAIHAEGAALILVTTRREVAEAMPGRILQLRDGALISGDAVGAPSAPQADAIEPAAPADEAEIGETEPEEMASDEFEHDEAEAEETEPGEFEHDEAEAEETEPGEFEHEVEPAEPEETESDGFEHEVEPADPEEAERDEAEHEPPADEWSEPESTAPREGRED